MPQCLHVMTYIRLELWQLTFVIDWNLRPVEEDTRVPDLLRIGQYLHVDLRLHSWLESVCLVIVLVEALTRWSDRFLFRREPNTILASARKRVV